MWTQYGLFRAQGAGSLRDLVLGVSRDVAMIRWLDGNANRKGHANENYARELQELFTLGIGNYTETDIREVARAFTGWHSRHHEFVFQERFHDAGEKTIHGKTGPLRRRRRRRHPRGAPGLRAVHREEAAPLLLASGPHAGGGRTRSPTRCAWPA